MNKTNNSLNALRDMLFTQLEAITNPDLEGEKLSEEIERSHAVQKLSSEIIKSADLELSAIKFADQALDYDVHTDIKRITNGE